MWIRALLVVFLVAAAPVAAQSFPAEALGMTFGAPVASAESACSSVGGTWQVSGSLYRCSVPPSPIGHQGPVTVHPCEDGVSICMVAFSMHGTDAVVAAWRDLSTALEGRYGAAAAHDDGPHRCASAFRREPSAAALRCVARSPDVDVQSRWSVGGGSISLGLSSERAPAGEVILNLMYLSPRWRAEAARRAEPPPDTRSL